MAKTAFPSRLNPFYLASKHAGACFFLVALGLTAGTAWRCLFQPTRYRSLARSVFSISPPEQADRFDWNGKIEGWRALLANPADQDLLAANLRHVVKLAATRGADPDTESLSTELSLFHPARRYSALLLDNRLPPWLTRSIEVARRDIAANMDFQSLAAVASDLNPPQGATGWDFSFFDAERGDGPESSVITLPGPGDRHFRVFYLLHELLRGQPASSPEEAWRTTAEEIAGRLDREADFAGGGGFGRLAGRELMREIEAIPVLAANGLYRAASRSRDPSPDHPFDQSFPARRWTENFTLDSERRGRTEGVLSAGMTLDLHPLGFPRDTVLTRIHSLAANTLLAYIAAMEKNLPPEQTPLDDARSVPPPREREQATAQATAIVRVAPANPVPTVDREAEAGRRDRILALEERLRRARLDRDSALRRLEDARETERNLTIEALSARDRSDRLGERYLEASGSGGNEPERADAEAARLLFARDAVLGRLTSLLQTCTEEHPFVRAARRELAAIDSLLSKIVPAGPDAGAMEARNARLSQMRIEWDRAKAAAANLDARRRRLFDASGADLAAVADAEDRIASTETELARLRGEPPPMTEHAAPEPAPAAEPERETPPTPEPARAAVPSRAEAAPTEAAPVAAFSAAPTDTASKPMAPSWGAPIVGGFLGLCLALLHVLFRELAAGRFGNADQARRMVKLPLLAALPVYDPTSFRAAARSMRGEIFGNKPGGMAFIPLPVDFAEPKPEARRGHARPARRRLPVGLWAAGILMLGLAGALAYLSVRGIAVPRTPFLGEMRVPTAEDFDPSGSAGTVEPENRP